VLFDHVDSISSERKYSEASCTSRTSEPGPGRACEAPKAANKTTGQNGMLLAITGTKPKEAAAEKPPAKPQRKPA
jgi:hypothetical protein